MKVVHLIVPQKGLFHQKSCQERDKRDEYGTAQTIPMKIFTCRLSGACTRASQTDPLGTAFAAQAASGLVRRRQQPLRNLKVTGREQPPSPMTTETFIIPRRLARARPSPTMEPPPPPNGTSGVRANEFPEISTWTPCCEPQESCTCSGPSIRIFWASFCSLNISYVLGSSSFRLKGRCSSIFPLQKLGERRPVMFPTPVRASRVFSMGTNPKEDSRRCPLPADAECRSSGLGLHLAESCAIKWHKDHMNGSRARKHHAWPRLLLISTPRPPSPRVGECGGPRSQRARPPPSHAYWGEGRGATA